MLKIDHVGIAVFSINEALPFFRDALELPLKKIEEVPSEGVRTAILPVGEAKIELLEPLGDKSPLHAFLKKFGEGIHHLALRTPSLKDDLARLARKGVASLGAVRPGVEKSEITFIHPRQAHGVLLELCGLRENPNG